MKKYWEAAGAIHLAMSKYLDAAVATGSFHLQSNDYNHVKPPCFKDYPGINFQPGLRRRRRANTEHKNNPTTGNNFLHYNTTGEKAELKSQSSADWSFVSDLNTARNSNATSSGSACYYSNNHHNHQHPPPNNNNSSSTRPHSSGVQIATTTTTTTTTAETDEDAINSSSSSSTSTTIPPAAVPLIPNNNNNNTENSQHSNPSEPYNCRPFANPTNRPAYQMHEKHGDIAGPPQLDGGIISQPSLFLQEWCHLVSLLNAVALGSLRTDFTNHHIPMCEYIGGSEWPPADSHYLIDSTAVHSFSWWHRISDTFSYWLGLNRGPEHAKKYMEAVPLAGMYVLFALLLRFALLCWIDSSL